MVQGGGLTADMNNKSSGTAHTKMKQIMACLMIEELLLWLEPWTLTLLLVSFL